MRTTARLLVMFVLFHLFSYSRALKRFEDMNWKTDPRTAWPPDTPDRLTHRIVILLLNIRGYLNSSVESTIISTGVLLDNSRILTSYNPFRSLISSSYLTDKILALLPTGLINNVVELRIAKIVCGRQIAYVPDNKNQVWHDSQHSPLHDLMIIRLEEEIGVAMSSYKFSGFIASGDYYWFGNLSKYENTMISNLAGLNDIIVPEVTIVSIGLRNKRQEHHDKLIRTNYEEDDAVLADCEEWLPREWGYFICIRHIDDFPGLGSGATLYSRNKLFGIGSFAMFRNDTGVLVFTDVRHYRELIMETCGDEEFT